MLKPTGFWSYTSSDDTASRGRLSQLRRLLADELQLKIGRTPKVHIFQDVAAIPHGTDWLKEIHRALDDSSFLIPIVTPAFLQSEMCCKEVMRFRQREVDLHRDDLIFPFHYIGVDDVDPDQQGECHDAAVLRLLRSRQWIDFRLLRLRNPDGEDVALKLETLADSLRAALRRDGVPVAAVPRPAVGPTQAKPSTLAARATPSVPAPGSVIRNGRAYPEMVWIPPGRYVMGVPKKESTRERWNDDAARPQHEVTISQGFYLGKYPVTRAEFAAFVMDTGRDMSGEDWTKPGVNETDRHPAVFVSHVDATAYAKWLSDKTEEDYRLPSEAEWEYAARAGTTTARFWGDSWDDAPAYANTQQNGTTAVGRFKPNSFGLCDMLGNVREWTADHWHETYAGAPADGSPWTGGDAGSRVARGGSGWDDPRYVRVGVRAECITDEGVDALGFRVARTCFSPES